MIKRLFSSKSKTPQERMKFRILIPFLIAFTVSVQITHQNTKVVAMVRGSQDTYKTEFKIE